MNAIQFKTHLAVGETCGIIFFSRFFWLINTGNTNVCVCLRIGIIWAKCLIVKCHNQPTFPWRMLIWRVSVCACMFDLWFIISCAIYSSSCRVNAKKAENKFHEIKMEIIIMAFISIAWHLRKYGNKLKYDVWLLLVLWLLLPAVFPVFPIHLMIL